MGPSAYAWAMLPDAGRHLKNQMPSAPNGTIRMITHAFRGARSRFGCLRADEEESLQVPCGVFPLSLRLAARCSGNLERRDHRLPDREITLGA